MQIAKQKAFDGDIELIEGEVSKKHSGGKNLQYWHIYYKDKRAGRVYIKWVPSQTEEGYASITVELNKDKRGIGIGTICFQRACELSRYDIVFAEIRKGNIASKKAASRAGFQFLEGYQGSQIKMIWLRNLKVSK
jgi:RimJ/RimL family protein N-acetyltransferase